MADACKAQKPEPKVKPLEISAGLAFSILWYEYVQVQSALHDCPATDNILFDMQTPILTI